MSKESIIESLANKYRPQVFEDLIGQSHIVTQLQGMIKSGRWHSTILLHGPSGTGKTSLSRMIARYAQCTKLVDGNPCGKCVNCTKVEHPDVIEMNMANTRGIDDVRALEKSAKNMPFTGRFRIFVIDEIHMCSPQAAQCLLKILESSPKKTLWILGTTNPEKLPPAIIGRCLKLNTKQIERKDIRRRLLQIAKLEGQNLKQVEGYSEILDTIVDLSNGQMRDAIQMLDSVLLTLASGSKDVDADLIITKYLMSDEANLDQAAAQLLLSILTKDYTGIVRVIRTSNARGLVSKFRWLLMYFLDNEIGNAKFQPYSAKHFLSLTKKERIVPKLPHVISLQQKLLEAEARMNSMSVDESVILLSYLGTP